VVSAVEAEAAVVFVVVLPASAAAFVVFAAVPDFAAVPLAAVVPILFEAVVCPVGLPLPAPCREFAAGLRSAPAFELPAARVRCGSVRDAAVGRYPVAGLDLASDLVCQLLLDLCP